MPGLELFSSINSAVSPADSPSTHTPVREEAPELPTASATVTAATSTTEVSVPHGLSGPAPYYNARLDPKNFLEGPLSWNPATRLRQMLARPGIVVRHLPVSIPICVPDPPALSRRSRLASATALARGAPSRPASTACTRGEPLARSTTGGAQPC